MKKRHGEIGFRAVFALIACLGGAGAFAAEKPNIILIFADNFGYVELGSYGGGITRGAPTARLDTLARQGTRLTEKSAREFYPTFQGNLPGNELHAIKWRNYKLHFIRQA